MYVTLAQSVWLTALARASPQTISVGTTALFVLTLIWAMVILGDFPTGPQWIGSGFIVAAIASSIARSIKRGRDEPKPRLTEGDEHYVPLAAEEDVETDDADRETITQVRFTEDAAVRGA